MYKYYKLKVVIRHTPWCNTSYGKFYDVDIIDPGSCSLYRVNKLAVHGPVALFSCNDIYSLLL